MPGSKRISLAAFLRPSQSRGLPPSPRGGWGGAPPRSSLAVPEASQLPLGGARANLAYAAFLAFATLICLPTVLTMVDTWATSSAYHHGFLIPPLVVSLLRRAKPPSRRERGWGKGPAAEISVDPPLTPDPSSQGRGGKGRGLRLPLLAIAASLLLWLAGRAISANIVEQFAFVSLLISGAVAIFGGEWARARAFPLALLYFMVPAGTTIQPALQEIAAAGASLLLGVGGVEFTRDGLIFATAAGRFEIAPGCSGLNFLLASLLISSVYAYLAMSGWRKRVAFVAAGAALALVANALRVFLVIAIATWSGGKIAIAEDHLVFGWVLYGVILFAFLLIGRRYADPQPQEAAH